VDTHAVIVAIEDVIVVEMRIGVNLRRDSGILVFLK
jgi:hypothetical protein